MKVLVIQPSTNRQDRDRSGIRASVLVLTAFTLLTFVNSWPDVLIFDDSIHLGPESQHRLEHLGDAFSRSLWNQGTGLYRPLLAIDFELQTRLFGSWLEGYHLVNIFMHVLTTLFLFGFLNYFIRFTQPEAKNHQFFALVAALVFAVHPTHAEVVNSVFNKSSMYVSLAAIAGLWWLLANLARNPARAWTGFGLIYTVAIFFKESALVLPGIAVAMIVLFTGGTLKERLIRFLPVFWLLIPIALFFWARSATLASTGVDAPVDSEDAIYTLGSTQIVFNWSGAMGLAQFGQGLKILAWPYPPRLYYGELVQWQIITFIGIQVVLGLWAVYLWVKGRPMLAFSLLFYYLALLPSIRLISLDNSWPHIAERYLYFPSVGLSLAVVAALWGMSARLERKHVMFIMLPVILALATISWDRNADWNSAAQLFETEYQLGSRGGSAMRVLLAAHHNEGRFERVAEICDENLQFSRESYNFALACMNSYLETGRTDAAIAALELHTDTGEHWLAARLALASIYRARKQYQQVVGQFAAIIDKVEDPAKKDLYKGEMLVMVFPDDREQLELARRLFQQALARDPGLKAPESRIRDIDRRLAEMETRAPGPDADRE